MNSLYLKLYVKFQNLMNGEEGQDLVEYALLVALVSLAAVAGLNGLAGAISGVFTSISTSLTNA
jgi:pilus assembly protein Flp/PilA